MSAEPFTFYREDDGTLPLKSAVYQAIGAASVCWESMSGTGVFDDARACRVAEALLAEIEAATDKGPAPEFTPAEWATWERFEAAEPVTEVDE